MCDKIHSYALSHAKKTYIRPPPETLGGHRKTPRISYLTIGEKVIAAADQHYYV